MRNGNLSQHKFYKNTMKRTIDLFLSLLIMALFWWLYIIIAILVKKNFGSPVLFSQERPGKNEKLFSLHKFRSMTNEKDNDGNLLPDDQRLTKFGKMLRATSLDEIPEIFNILKGEMSFIGPRPLLTRYLPYYTEEEHHRHDVRPGITGLAQVNGRNFITWEEIFSYDLDYVKRCSLLLDIEILIKTIAKVLTHSDISDATQGVEDSSGKRVHDALDKERSNVTGNWK